MVKKMIVGLVITSLIAALGWGFWLALSITAGVEMGFLKAENEILKESNELLNASYTTLYSRYNSLKDQYAELEEVIESGEAIARSATWITADERLEVTSELIPEYYSDLGEISSYDVKVTVTNVGGQPLDVVWIFLFPYVDGKLCEYWGPISYSHSVENLYIGETYTHTFTWITKEMTSYRVFALGSIELWTRFEKVEITSCYAVKETTPPYNYTVTVTLKNSGSADATITYVLVNGKPADEYLAAGKCQILVWWNTTDPVAASGYLPRQPMAIPLGKSGTITLEILGTLYESGTTLDLKFHSTAGKDYPQMLALP